jgi:hypothetical protein
VGDIAIKILLGVATAAVWFALSRAATATPVYGASTSVAVAHHVFSAGAATNR